MLSWLRHNVTCLKVKFRTAWQNSSAQKCCWNFFPPMQIISLLDIPSLYFKILLNNRIDQDWTSPNGNHLLQEENKNSKFVCRTSNWHHRRTKRKKKRHRAVSVGPHFQTHPHTSLEVRSVSALIFKHTHMHHSNLDQRRSSFSNAPTYIFRSWIS